MSEPMIGATCHGKKASQATGRYIGYGLMAWVSAMTNETVIDQVGELCESNLPQITDREVYSCAAVARYFSIHYPATRSSSGESGT